jgi:membrane fusion protein, multidrug efflux system
VQVATADGNEAVIAAGLQPGALVVSAGVHVLSPGQKVTIFKANTAQAQQGIAQAATKNVAFAGLPTATAAASAAVK